MVKKTTWKSHREESKIDYGYNYLDGEGPTLENLRTGALLRIADSLERMETPYVALLRDYENVKRYKNNAEAENVRLGHVIAGLRGALKRAKDGKRNVK